MNRGGVGGESRAGKRVKGRVAVIMMSKGGVREDNDLKGQMDEEKEGMKKISLSVNTQMEMRGLCFLKCIIQVDKLRCTIMMKYLNCRLKSQKFILKRWKCALNATLGLKVSTQGFRSFARKRKELLRCWPCVIFVTISYRNIQYRAKQIVRSKCHRLKFSKYKPS